MVICLNVNAEDCNPKKDIVEQSGKFIYSESCHLEFGKLKIIEKDRQKQIQHMQESIKLKDLALDLSNKRIELWQDSTYKIENRFIKMQNNNENMKLVYFGLGVLIMGGATWAASQMR